VIFPPFGCETTGVQSFQNGSLNCHGLRGQFKLCVEIKERLNICTLKNTRVFIGKTPEKPLTNAQQVECV
jgi:hypothetical protein